MKTRRLAILLLLVLCSNVASGQYRRQSLLRRFSYGVKTGFTLTDMRLTAKCYRIYDYSMRPYGSLGAWIQYRSESGITVRPELTLVGRGSNISCHDVTYSVSSTCLNLRVNLQLHMYIPRTTSSIYFVVAPTWNATLGGRVHFSSEEIESLEMKLSSSSMNINDVNIFAGLGFEIPMFIFGRDMEFSGELGYYFCLTNSFTTDEQTNNVTVLNNLLYSQPNTGSRLFSGIEASVRLGIPFGKKIRIRR